MHVPDCLASLFDGYARFAQDFLDAANVPAMTKVGGIFISILSQALLAAISVARRRKATTIRVAAEIGYYFQHQIDSSSGDRHCDFDGKSLRAG
jgi:hypothetical protein